MTKEIVGLNIRRHRKTLKMTQEQLAEASCIGESTLRNIERGTVNMSVEKLCRIAKALNVTPNDLTVGVEEWESIRDSRLDSLSPATRGSVMRCTGEIMNILIHYIELLEDHELTPV